MVSYVVNYWSGGLGRLNRKDRVGNQPASNGFLKAIAKSVACGV
jgi:hypothetical protein